MDHNLYKTKNNVLIVPKLFKSSHAISHFVQCLKIALLKE